MFFAKPPFLVKKFYPGIWNKTRSEKTIYLSFDDGPIPRITPFVLSVLKKYNAKATFFCVGENVKRNPEIFEQIKSEGHTVGNHTYNHLNGWKTKTADYVDNVEICSRLVDSKYFRPPYGCITFNQARLLKKKLYKIIMWDVLSGDYDKNINPDTCLSNVVRYANSGSIVVFHDNLKSEKSLCYALPKAVEYCLSRGYELKGL